MEQFLRSTTYSATSMAANDVVFKSTFRPLYHYALLRFTFAKRNDSLKFTQPLHHCYLRKYDILIF